MMPNEQKESISEKRNASEIPPIAYGLQTFNTLMCIKRKQRAIIQVPYWVSNVWEKKKLHSSQQYNKVKEDKKYDILNSTKSKVDQKLSKH